jgi:hypothetical protein
VVSLLTRQERRLLGIWFLSVGALVKLSGCEGAGGDAPRRSAISHSAKAEHISFFGQRSQELTPKVISEANVTGGKADQVERIAVPETRRSIAVSRPIQCCNYPDAHQAADQREQGAIDRQQSVERCNVQDNDTDHTC